MFAVIKTGGKQYKVVKNDVIIVERLIAEAGSTVELADVLMLGETGKPVKTASTDLLKATVFAEVLEQSRADKIIVFKKKRRHNYRRKAGHRQDQTVLRITGISASGTKPKATTKKVTAVKNEKKANDVKSSKKAVTKTTKKVAPKTEVKSKTKPKPKAKAPAKKKIKE
jgi:large subunit ribosomal protein L21